MRKIILSIAAILLLSVTTSVAQTTNLFTWQNGNVVAGSSSFTPYRYYQPTDEREAHLQSRAKVLHTIPVQCISGQYKCKVQILGTQGVDEDDSHLFYQFQLRDQYNNNLIFKRFGTHLPFTTTWSLSKNYEDTNYFRKVDLDNVSYALFFTGMTPSLDDDLPEMVIVVVSRNVATLVYDGPAAAIDPTTFGSSYFAMNFITDGTGLRDPETGLFNISSGTIGTRPKYAMIKSGNVLSITSY